MLLAAGGVIWFGYALLAYGVSQVRGCNAGFVDLIWPGRNPVCNKDTGGGSSGPTKTPTTPGNCPSGQVFDLDTGKCVKTTATTKCGKGQVLFQGKCISTCPAREG